jgi:DNA-binding NtrC family response regulator
MPKSTLLKGKVVLAVDDEPDVLDLISEQLSECQVHQAETYETALQHLMSYTYDIVILDIMGVNGFDLLKHSVARGFPTVMLTAHALSPESIKKSIKLGAVSFLPKESLPALSSFLEDVLSGGGKSAWRRVFDRLGGFFEQRFGPDWKKKDKFFQRFEEEIREILDDKAGRKT